MEDVRRSALFVVCTIPRRGELELGRAFSAKRSASFDHFPFSVFEFVSDFEFPQPSDVRRSLLLCTQSGIL